METRIVPPATDIAAGQIRYVVIVDDDVHLLFTVAMLLQRFNYHVCTVKTGDEALEMILVAAPALVITALELPSMSGLDLFYVLQQDPRTTSVPVIAITGNGDPDIMARCERTGFAACLQTPVAAEELYRAVQHAVEPRPRSNIRVYTWLPVTVDHTPLDCGGGECATVLSEHGLYIRTLKPSEPNTVITIELMLHGRPIAAEAVVLYKHRFGEGPFGEPGMGLKFLRIDPIDQQEIRQFIRSEITHGIVPA
jgi:CheY-like chemotaxis protein